MSVNLKVYGNFETYHVHDRKLTFKKKEFHNVFIFSLNFNKNLIFLLFSQIIKPYEYLKELKMIK